MWFGFVFWGDRLKMGGHWENYETYNEQNISITFSLRAIQLKECIKNLNIPLLCFKQNHPVSHASGNETDQPRFNIINKKANYISEIVLVLIRC